MGISARKFSVCNGRCGPILGSKPVGVVVVKRALAAPLTQTPLQSLECVVHQCPFRVRKFFILDAFLVLGMVRESPMFNMGPEDLEQTLLEKSEAVEPLIRRSNYVSRWLNKTYICILCLALGNVILFCRLQSQAAGSQALPEASKFGMKFAKLAPHIADDTQLI